MKKWDHIFERVYIEILNICNLQCDFCPPVVRTRKIMEPCDFRKILKQVAPITKEICLHLMGEPLGHPKLSEILETCSEFQVPVNFTTNGVLLNREQARLLLNPIIRQVNISIHSFEANYGEKDVMPYMDKVFSFTDNAFEKRPDLYINYRIWDLQDPRSLTSKNALIRKTIDEKFDIKTSEIRVDIRRQKGYKVKNRLYLNFDSRFTWPALDQEIRSTKGFCHALSHHFGIHANGVVVPCCLDKEAVINLGNCLETPLEEILLLDRAQNMLRGFQNKELVEPLCQRCSFVKRFDRKKTTNYSN